MSRYLVLLRGINVGGNNLISMADLRSTFESMGFKNVSTYIQTGNIFFESEEKDINKIEKYIANQLKVKYPTQVGLVVFSKDEWKGVIEKAPAYWGTDPNFKHNLMIMLRPYNKDMPSILKAIGELKPDIVKIDIGDGVVYQSLSWKDFGKTTSGRIASNPIYKQMTIRTYNTAIKLLYKF